MKISLANSDAEIENYYAVMAGLRPHLSAEEFFVQVKRQITDANFRLVYLFDNEVKAVGGFRVAEWLAGEKYMEIEDLATKDGERSKDYGGALFDWLVERARA